jgi:periplasmic protein TonB
MRDQLKEFEMLLDDVLCEVANPEPVECFEQMVMRQIDVVQSSVLAGVVAGEQDRRVLGDVGRRSFFAGTQELGVFGSLWSSVRELLFPRKLPPLTLESRPIAVVDRMAFESNHPSTPSTAYAVGLHALVIVLIGFVVNAQIRSVTAVRDNVTALVNPPRVVPKTDQIGGGGGQQGPTPATKGSLPRLAEEQIVPPKAPPLQEPKIKIDPSIVVQEDVRMASILPQIGVPNSPIVGMSMGDKSGTGLGSGDGPGFGPGSGGNVGGGVHHPGGGISAPKVLFQPEPEFSEEARRAKVSGNVEVYLWVDEHGNPSHVRVVRGIGMGLDEKAVEAVRQYRFKPAMENGRPVTVEMYVDVVFQIL